MNQNIIKLKHELIKGKLLFYKCLKFTVFVTAIIVISYAYHSKEYAKAEPLLLRSLLIRKNVLGPQHPNIATTENTIALTYAGKGKLAEAEKTEADAVAILQKALGANHPDVKTLQANLDAIRRNKKAKGIK